jgi:hypothetical protein
VTGLLLAFVLVAGAEEAPAIYHKGSNGFLLPNRHVTPGVTVTITKKRVCETKWGLDARAVTVSMKREVCARYGLTCPVPRTKDTHPRATACTGNAEVCKHGVELDHLISKELGGADDVKNLWAQKIEDALLKDRLENFLRRAVCTGAIALEEAQTAIREDWTKAYFKMKGEP